MAEDQRTARIFGLLFIVRRGVSGRRETRGQDGYVWSPLVFRAV